MNRADRPLPLLNPGPQPAYERLYAAFRDAILKRQLLGGERVPSSRSLAAFYGVARVTVTQAYDQLIAEGYLETRRGAGTYVAAILPETFQRSAKARSLPPARKDSRRSASELRNECRYCEQPPFLSGCPDLESFPRAIWLKLYGQHLSGSPLALNSYGHSDGGYLPLREAVAAYLNTHRGLDCSAEQILILNGSQSGIELAARALAGRNALVATENPCYRGIVNAFRLAGAALVGIPVDAEGISVESLRSLPRPPRMAVVTASRQFPLGHAMSISRRAALLQWASANRSWILEDDYDSEFRFRGNPLPAMQGMDRAGRTLYLGTFSRSMFPDLRIGYLVTPMRLKEDLLQLWRTSGLNPPVALQATLADFMRAGHYLRHARKMRLLYARRSAFLADLIATRLSDWFELGVTDGGLHFVGYFRRPIDPEDLARRGKGVGLELFPLSRYALEPLARDGLIFGYSSFDEPMLVSGVERLELLLRTDGR